MMTNPPNIKQAENELDNVANSPYKENEDVADKTPNVKPKIPRQNINRPQKITCSNSKLANKIPLMNFNKPSHFEVMEDVLLDAELKVTEHTLLKEKVNYFDMIVHNIVVTYWKEGGTIFTTSQVWQSLNPNKKTYPSDENLLEIEKSLFKLRNVFAFIDATKEYNSRRDNDNLIDELIYRGIPLLDVAPIKRIQRLDGVIDDGYEITREPVLYAYENKVNKQLLDISGYDIGVALTGIRNTIQNYSIAYYIIKRLETLKHRGSHISNIIKYETLFDMLQIKELNRHKEMRIKNTVVKILENLKNDERCQLKDFTETTKSKTRVSVKLLV